MSAIAFVVPMLAAIVLNGLSGEGLRARAHFDANNVRLGDPMILSIDFTGEADFSDIHPPALAKTVDGKAWRVYDTGAKTETFRDGRRLTYRVRPLKEGLLEFPALEFSYAGSGDGGERTVSTKAMPVHVKPGTQAALAGLDAEGEDGFRMPDGIVIALSRKLSDDEAFRWRKACRNPKAEEFAKFDFPEARLNEAACHTLDGNWSKALKIYSALEWRTGQTPAMERGIVAALSRKLGGDAELPVWRSALRPVLKHAWRGRVLLIAAVLLAFAAAMWTCGKIIRALAVLAVAVAAVSPQGARAEDMFEQMRRQMDEQMQRMQQMQQQMMGAGGGMSMTINGVRQEPVEIKATLKMDKPSVRVGEEFRFVIAVEAPEGARLGQMRFTPSETVGMEVLGNIETMADGTYTVPVRYDVPFIGEVAFRIDGMVSSTVKSGSAGRMSSFSFSRNFTTSTDAFKLEIRPLPGDGRPEGFAGAVGAGFRLKVDCEPRRVETNDVVRVLTEISFSGYLPPGEDEVERTNGRVVRESYFVADGSERVPGAELVYYDANAKKYRTVKAKGPKLEYCTGEEDVSDSVAVNALANQEGKESAIVLRFAPGESFPVVATVHGGEKVEEHGDWVRIDDGSHAGWAKKEDVR